MRSVLRLPLRAGLTNERPSKAVSWSIRLRAIAGPTLRKHLLSGSKNAGTTSSRCASAQRANSLSTRTMPHGGPDHTAVVVMSKTSRPWLTPEPPTIRSPTNFHPHHPHLQGGQMSHKVDGRKAGRCVEYGVERVCTKGAPTD